MCLVEIEMRLKRNPLRVAKNTYTVPGSYNRYVTRILGLIIFVVSKGLPAVCVMTIQYKTSLCYYTLAR